MNFSAWSINRPLPAILLFILLTLVGLFGFQQLAEKFSPGPLTYVMPKRSIVPDIVTGGGDTVALRVPGHPLTLKLLGQLDFPLAAPSANPFGYISPVLAEHVAEQLDAQERQVSQERLARRTRPDHGQIHAGVPAFPRSPPAVWRVERADGRVLEGKVAIADVPPERETCSTSSSLALVMAT